jgi:hypothetical protein
MAPRKAFLLRISPALWEELERWAAGEFRSVNGQIEYLLQQAVNERRKGSRGRVRTGTGEPAPGAGPEKDEGGKEP